MSRWGSNPGLEMDLVVVVSADASGAEAAEESTSCNNNRVQSQ